MYFPKYSIQLVTGFFGVGTAALQEKDVTSVDMSSLLSQA
jgi:hypothetical protein